MGARTIVWFGAALGMALLSAVTLTTTALAAQPETTKSDSVEIDVPVANCGSFTIVANYTGTVRTTVYFNADGDPIRLLFQGRAFGTLTNSATGYSVKDAPSVRNTFVDFVKGTQTNAGVDFHITVPGAGVVVLQAGRIVFQGGPPPVFIAGPHLSPPQQTAALCAALNH